MEISIIRGLVFFGLLFIASLFLSPGWILAFLPRDWQAWAVRRWTSQLGTQVAIFLTATFVALCSWLISNAHRTERGNHPAIHVSSGATMGVVGMRAWP